MTLPRRKLTDEEMADAARLSAIWARQRKPMHLTQEQAASECGWTQGAFNQYLHALTPLNLEAAIKIARVLNVRVEDFSPRLAKKLIAPHPAIAEDEAVYSAPYLSQRVQKDILRIARLYENGTLSDASLSLIRKIAEQMALKK